MCRVSFPVSLASPEPRPLLVYFYSFSFFYELLFPCREGQVGMGGLRGSALSRIGPVKRPPYTPPLLNTLAHNGGSVTQPPNLLLPSPKTGNHDLPSSCFSTNFLLSCPFHRLFSLFSLSGSPQIRSLIYISSCSYGNQLL